MLIGWQPDELPQFVKILDILVIVGSPVLVVEKFTTVGINNYILGYLIVHNHQRVAISISKLLDSRPFTGHIYF